ncbi:hypothetical protein ABT104_20020 [Streptomyces mobaraensis]|uniref:hypothetical protein n=1 Tax=Streptomyces mobaraensis TaxID=35621 RepID=UPI00332853B9
MPPLDATPPASRALPAPASRIRLTYIHEETWWDDPDSHLDRWHVSADLFDPETDQTIGHIGDLEFVRVDPYETRDLFGLMDGEDGDLGVIGETILNGRTGHFHDDLDELLAGLGSSMLILNSAKLEDAWRGFGLGVVLAGRAIKRLGAGSRGAACYPAPLDRRTSRGTETDRDQAIAALGHAWQQLGFEHYRDGVFVLDLGTTALNTNLKDLTARIDNLPQPDDDEWDGKQETS